MRQHVLVVMMFLIRIYQELEVVAVRATVTIEQGERRRAGDSPRAERASSPSWQGHGETSSKSRYQNRTFEPCQHAGSLKTGCVDSVHVHRVHRQHSGVAEERPSLAIPIRSAYISRDPGPCPCCSPAGALSANRTQPQRALSSAFLSG